MTFRKLRADEIECRIATCTSRGVSLLLYKDARCDQNILDETVGAMNWMRHHSRDNANCIVSIWDADKGQWIEKEDTGTESNTEKEKGLASDSFKRACFNWGIGRELYTAPFIWVNPKSLKKLTQDERGKWKCGDRFRVTSIEYDANRITLVEIVNSDTGELLQYGQPASVAKVAAQTISSVKVSALRTMCAKDGIDTESLLKLYKVERFEDLTEGKHSNMIEHWEEIKARYGNSGQA